MFHSKFMNISTLPLDCIYYFCECIRRNGRITEYPILLAKLREIRKDWNQIVKPFRCIKFTIKMPWNSIHPEPVLLLRTEHSKYAPYKLVYVCSKIDKQINTQIATFEHKFVNKPIFAYNILWKLKDRRVGTMKGGLSYDSPSEFDDLYCVEVFLTIE